MYQITYLLLTKYTLAQLISSYLTLFMRHEAKKVLFAFIAFELSSFQEKDTKLDLFLLKNQNAPRKVLCFVPADGLGMAVKS